MDAEGKQLSPEGQKEMTAFLFDQRPWAEYREITVVKDYVVRAPDVRGDTAQTAVEGEPGSTGDNLGCGRPHRPHSGSRGDRQYRYRRGFL